MKSFDKIDNSTLKLKVKIYNFFIDRIDLTMQDENQDIFQIIQDIFPSSHSQINHLQKNWKKSIRNSIIGSIFTALTIIINKIDEEFLFQSIIFILVKLIVNIIPLIFVFIILYQLLTNLNKDIDIMKFFGRTYADYLISAKCEFNIGSWNWRNLGWDISITPSSESFKKTELFNFINKAKHERIPNQTQIWILFTTFCVVGIGGMICFSLFTNVFDREFFDIYDALAFIIFFFIIMSLLFQLFIYILPSGFRNIILLKTRFVGIHLKKTIKT